MILVLFLCVIILISFFILLTGLLSIQIDIKNFKLYKEEKLKRKTNNNYQVYINVYVFRKIKIFKYRINNKKFPKKYFQKMQNKIDFSILKSFFLNNFNNLNVKIIELESLNLNVEVGTENVILTSTLTTISNILIPIFLSKLITNYNRETHKYVVKPVYGNKNQINLFLESKIRIQVFSFIKTFNSYVNARKKVDENEEKITKKNFASILNSN